MSGLTGSQETLHFDFDSDDRSDPAAESLERNDDMVHVLMIRSIMLDPRASSITGSKTDYIPVEQCNPEDASSKALKSEAAMKTGSL